VLNGWSSLGASLGNYGTDYGARAVVALIGFGAVALARIYIL
jgi:hypothetical protein